ncbi:hypothetical protein AB6E89_12645 [Vibrio breoganii]
MEIIIQAFGVEFSLNTENKNIIDGCKDSYHIFYNDLDHPCPAYATAALMKLSEEFDSRIQSGDLPDPGDVMVNLSILAGWLLESDAKLADGRVYAFPDFVHANKKLFHAEPKPTKSLIITMPGFSTQIHLQTGPLDHIDHWDPLQEAINEGDCLHCIIRDVRNKLLSLLIDVDPMEIVNIDDTYLASFIYWVALKTKCIDKESNRIELHEFLDKANLLIRVDTGGACIH